MRTSKRAVRTLGAIVFIVILLTLLWQTISNISLKYEKDFINRDQAYKIAYGIVLKECIDEDDAATCRKLVLATESSSGSGWVFRFRIKDSANLGKPYEDNIYINRKGYEITEKLYISM